MFLPQNIAVVRASFVDDARISREELLQKLLLFYDPGSGGSNFLSILNGIVFLAGEVKE